MKEVDVLGSPSLIVRAVSVDAKQRKATLNTRRQIYTMASTRGLFLVIASVFFVAFLAFEIGECM